MVDVPTKQCTGCGEMKPLSAFYGDKSKRDGLRSHCKKCDKEWQPLPKETLPDGFKRCTGCQEVLPCSMFCVNRRAKDGLTYRCRGCQKRYSDIPEVKQRKHEYKLAYYAENADRLRAYTREWAANNKEYVRAWRHLHYIKNATRIKARVRIYSEEHREERRAYGRLWREENKDSLRAYARQRYLSNKSLYNQKNRLWRQNNPDKVRAIKHRRRARLAGNGGSHTAEEIGALRIQQHNRCAYCQRWTQQLQTEHIVPIKRGGTDDISNICLACPTCNSSKGDKLLSEWIHRWYLEELE